MSLWTPPGADIPVNETDATEQWASPEEVAYDSVAAVEWQKFLRKVDPRLSIIFAKPFSRVWPVPNRWYIIRRNELVPDAFWVIQSEDGGYSPPTQKHIDSFLAGDAQRNPHLYEQHKKRREREREAAAKRFANKRAEFREKLSERLSHMYDTKVHVKPAHKEKLGDA